MTQTTGDTYSFHLGRKPYLRASLLGYLLIGLSPKNYVSIYWMAGTGISCCAAALIGLVPEILIGWTVHLPHPALVLFATAAAICLSLAGLAVTLVAVSFIIIGLIGAISFTR